MRLEVVEIDREMLKVASDWFGFHDDDITVHIADGLHFISQLADKGGNENGKFTDTRMLALTQLSVFL